MQIAAASWGSRSTLNAKRLGTMTGSRKMCVTEGAEGLEGGVRLFVPEGLPSLQSLSLPRIGRLVPSASRPY